MSTRGRGQRNWDDEMGADPNIDQLHTPHEQHSFRQHSRYQVTNQGNEFYTVTLAEYTWLVCRDADGALSVIETDYPTHRRDAAVLRAIGYH